MNKQHIQKGILLGVICYIIWGLLPIYWKALDLVGSNIVVAHRIIWSTIFMFIFILVTKQLQPFIKECRRILAHKKILFAITGASIIIALNWLVFIWAVQNDYVLQASLGYYINPLMSVLLGVIVLKERLSRLQQLSVLLAAIGVIYLTVSYNVFPWVSLFLASTFALYGLFKKYANLNATFSLTIETALLTPISLLYLIYFFDFQIGFQSVASTNLLLIGSGIVTALPLLLFGMAVINIPLSLTGILQYIAPTIMFFIGVFLNNEPFTTNHLITFILIWTSVILYLTSTLQQRQRRVI